MTNVARISPDRTVRDEAAILVNRLGWTYQGTNSAGHHEFTHPQHGELRMSSTPRNPKRFKINHRRDVARRMGLNLWQFERMLAGQPLEKRPQRRPRDRARRLPVSLRLAEPVEPRTPIRRLNTPAPNLRVRFYRCTSCMKPWRDDEHFPAQSCPLCGCQQILVDPPRSEAA